MNLTRIISIKERIATSDALKPDERDFVLECINEAIETTMAEAVARDRLAAERNYLGRIEAIWAALSIDDGGEGVCGAPFGDQMLPLIAADKTRFDQIRPVARKIAEMSGKPVRIAKFSKREDVEIFRP